MMKSTVIISILYLTDVMGISAVNRMPVWFLGWHWLSSLTVFYILTFAYVDIIIEGIVLMVIGRWLKRKLERRQRLRYAQSWSHGTLCFS